MKLNLIFGFCALSWASGMRYFQNSDGTTRTLLSKLFSSATITADKGTLPISAISVLQAVRTSSFVNAGAAEFFAIVLKVVKCRIGILGIGKRVVKTRPLYWKKRTRTRPRTQKTKMKKIKRKGSFARYCSLESFRKELSKD